MQTVQVAESVPFAWRCAANATADQSVSRRQTTAAHL